MSYSHSITPLRLDHTSTPTPSVPPTFMNLDTILEKDTATTATTVTPPGESSCHIVLPAPTRFSQHHHNEHSTAHGTAHGPAPPLRPTTSHNLSVMTTTLVSTSQEHVPNISTEAEEERLFLQGDFAPRKRSTRSGARQRRKGNGAAASSSSYIQKETSSGGLSRKRAPDPHPDAALHPARGIRERVLHFTPSWFAVTMGTGAIATLVNLLPWDAIHSGFRWMALVYLLLDIVIFLLFTAAFLTRYILYPQVLPLTIKHPQKSMFLGTFPMSMIVIISNISQLGTVEFGLGTQYAMAASVLWWIATAISLMTAIGVPFVVTTYQSHSFSSTTAALLLPIVPPITAAAVGASIAEATREEHPTYAFTIVIVSYLVLGVGLPLALLILVLYFQRLLLFKQPPREVIISVFLPLGPAGQGGEALLHLGLVAYRLFPSISVFPGSSASSVGNQLTNEGASQLTLPVGQAFFAAGLLGALMLWSFGMWWMALGIATVIREWRRGRLKFNMGWWGAVFPLASQAICTARIALVLSSLTLKIVYTILVAMTFVVWITVAIPTLRGFVDGSLLTRKAAPCIADLPLDPLKRLDAEIDQNDDQEDDEEEDGNEGDGNGWADSEEEEEEEEDDGSSDPARHGIPTKATDRTLRSDRAKDESISPRRQKVEKISRDDDGGGGGNGVLVQQREARSTPTPAGLELKD